ncbi:alpha/beta hydrolase [Undibacterium flavidum]|uniref:Alpha/beta hydrolase n=1 Tax=Undibacterium flavidum TaxID=2762297 RepID=A0ABR6Y628_9BURK|nr:alpha/beta hydrolase-fold protein [Undibacterium flavidum]MBC3872075.1 alpha/beta hydrolase [Undibacterium flavidum]
MKIFLTLVFGILISACASTNQTRATTPTAQNYNHLPALQGDYFKINSTYVSRDFHINVRLPQGYHANDATTYPVVYVLDGDSLFPLLAPTHLFLNYDEKLPEAIIVGISYGSFDPTINKRNIDFSASAIDAALGEDGAPRFLDFLKKELIPKIENQFRANAAKRILVGQSRAGYFVLWSALEDPDLFWGRIASNPALTPGRARFFEAAANHTKKDLKVAISSGTRDTEQRQRNATEWGTNWSSRTDAPWAVNLIKLEGGTHAATIGETYRRAMLWLFETEIAAVKVP